MKKLMMIAAACCLALCPLPAPADDVADAGPRMTKAAKKGKKARKGKKEKKEKKAKKKDKAPAITKEERDELKFKWYGTLKAALAAAKKYNTTCFVVYSDPARCPACARFEADVLNNREFKTATGIGVGFKSPTPLPQFGLNKSRPMTVVVDADGKIVSGNMGYHKGLTMDIYLDRLRNAQPPMLPSPAEDEEDED